jgi:hypothetical protein
MIKGSPNRVLLACLLLGRLRRSSLPQRADDGVGGLGTAANVYELRNRNTSLLPVVATIHHSPFFICQPYFRRTSSR